MKSAHDMGKAVQNTLDANDYEEFRRYLEKACGIVLGDNKQYLVTSRLNRLLQEYKLGSLSELLAAIRGGKSRELADRIIEAMTTNETSWFRDIHPYNTLKERILPEFSASKKSPLRIWSAACSSGQEPYSISMVINEFQMSNPGKLNADIQIIATDISPAILRAAEKGHYDDMSMARGLSPERKKRYFKETPTYWQVNPIVSSKVQFRQLNLLQSYALMGRFDVIFCRNVLIYFSSQLKKEIITKMCNALNPGGYLFLGGSESISGYTDDLQMVRTNGGVVYQRKT
jgi:chemotaxis protein methyltransferase CheR